MIRAIRCGRYRVAHLILSCEFVIKLMQYACTYWLQLIPVDGIYYPTRLAVCLHILVATTKTASQWYR